MTPDEMQTHVNDLATQLGCKIVQAPNMPGMMFVEEYPPRIEGPIIGTFQSPLRLITPSVSREISYLVLLHELGHVHHGHTQGRPPYVSRIHYFTNGVLNSEAEAWEWALDNMLLTTLHPTTVSVIRDNFIGSYHDHAVTVGLQTPGQRLGNGNRHWVPFAYGDDTTTRLMKDRMTSLSRELVGVA